MPTWPAVNIGGVGTLGIAIESLASPGTYTAPVKFFPIHSETLTEEIQNIKRRSLRGIVDMVGVVPGRTSIKGEITFELTEDVLPYFMYCMRMSVVKAGTTNFTYTGTPAQGAVPGSWSGRTMSITVVRNGIVFGYLGCVVSALDIDATDNGVVMAKASIIGLDEAVQTAPTPTWTVPAPFGPGSYTTKIPTATQVYDMDKFTFAVNDVATPQWRLQTVRIPSYVSFGERTVSFKTERDFTSRTEYDSFYKTATTLAGLTVVVSKSVNNQFTFVLPAPVIDAYDAGQLSGQATLIRTAATYEGTYDPGTSESYSLVAACQESVVLPA